MAKENFVSIWDVLIWPFLLIFWVVPSAFFWQLTVTQKIFLPYIPYYFWILPGKFWQEMPVLFIIFIVVFSFLFISIAFRFKVRLKKIRFISYIVLTLTICIHLIWGGAILVQ